MDGLRDDGVAAGEPFTASINGCARCRGEGHVDLEWKPLTNPTTISHRTGDGEVMDFLTTHWAMCPVVNEPIMWAVRIIVCER